MDLQPSDLHTAIASFFGVMVAEVIVKPVAIRIGLWLLRKTDDRIAIIPDWLSRPKKKCHED
jgi:hypothetical protein